MTERCPKCNTELVIALGIGPYCPNKECDVLDNILGVKHIIIDNTMDAIEKKASGESDES